MEQPVPSVETIAKNIPAWERYKKSLEWNISIAKNIQKSKITNDGIDEIQGIFNREVSPRYPSLKFSMDHIIINGSNDYEYQSDNVIIRYYGRNTWVHDDYDYFVDTFVQVDGKVIVDEKKQ